MMSSISIIMPCYGISEKEVLTSIKVIKSYFGKMKINFEIVVSQNGSMYPYAFKIPGVRLVYTEKKGLGLGIRNGLRVAKFKYFYFLPPDVSFKFTDFENMYPIRKKYDIVVGSKMIKGSIYKSSLLRKTVSRIQRLFTRILLGNFDIRDPNGTLFGKTKSALKILNKVRSQDFFFSTEFLYKGILEGFQVVEVPVVYIKSDKSSTVNIFKDGLNYLIQIWQLSFKG